MCRGSRSIGSGDGSAPHTQKRTMGNIFGAAFMLTIPRQSVSTNLIAKKRAARKQRDEGGHTLASGLEPLNTQGLSRSDPPFRAIVRLEIASPSSRTCSTIFGGTVARRREGLRHRRKKSVAPQMTRATMEVTLFFV